MIRFGSWSTVLGAAAAFGGLVALLLVLAPRNRVANRLLAVSTLRLVPHVIGFAGVYDAFPWLSFAPFDLSLAIGPLLYLYVRRLAASAPPPRWPLHFIPAAADLAYTLWAFALPLAEKTRWNDTVHVLWIDPVESFAALASLVLYLAATIRLRLRYQAWLKAQVSDRDAHRRPWLTTMLALIGLWLAVAAGFEIVDRLIRPLSYFNRFPEYLAFAGIVLGLGLEGWRDAGHRFPPMVAARPAPPEPGRDWTAQGAVWAERIAWEGWWREPDLTLALEAGFSSKASFNRVFREQTGMSPSQWRASHIPQTRENTPSEATAGPAAA